MNMNGAQRIGVVICSILIGLIVIFHAPWDGYAFYEHLFYALAERPVFYWFGDIVHVHVAIFFVLACFGIFFYLFRTQKQSLPSADPQDRRVPEAQNRPEGDA